MQKGESIAMARIKVPIQVNLPDDWIEQIVNRLRNDPEAEWVEIVRCKDCKYWMRENVSDGYCSEMGMGDCDEDFYCGYAVRKENR
jgi:hypothetical protein